MPSEEDRMILSRGGIIVDDDNFIITDLLAPVHPLSYPPIPEPQHKDDDPPETSTELLVTANPVDELFVQDSDGNYFPTSGMAGDFSVELDPPFPESAKLAYRRYWDRTFTTRILNQQEFTRAIESQEGMSETDTTSLSGKLGLGFAGDLPADNLLKLSAELSATTSHAVTITQNRRVIETYNFSVEADKVAIYTLWQLVETFALVDGDNNPIEWSGEVLFTVDAPPPFDFSFRRDAEFPPDRYVNNSPRYASSLHIFDA
jgi:hypothetical protein